MDTIFDKLGGRKFVALIILAIAALLADIFSSKGLTAELAGLLVGLYATFSGANAFTTAKSLAASGSNSDAGEVFSNVGAPSPDPRLEQVELQIQSLNNKLDEHDQALLSLTEAVTNTQKLVRALVSGGNNANPRAGA